MKFAVAIDVETTGARIGVKDAIVAVGAAVIDISGISVVETRRWTLDTSPASGVEWEPRCKEEFWDKFPAQLCELTGPAPPSVDIQPDAAVLLTPTTFARSWTEWMATVHARFGAVCIWTDFPAFDAAWMNVTLTAGGAPPLYLGGPGGSWQSIVDTDSYMDGLAARFTDKQAAYAARVQEESKALYPDGNHYPEKDAACIGLRFAYACSRLL
jgi:hypothetical protein